MKIIAHIALTCTLVLGGLVPALAQQGGSYVNTCNNIRQNGNMLYAQCRATNGQYIGTQIGLPCRGDIANVNGQLFCNRGGGGYHGGGYNGGGYNGGGYGGRLPAGSYVQTCRNVYVNGSMLSGSCQASNGQYFQTSLNINQCRGGTDIANIDGRLQCLYYR
jgi:hypothetical protein